MALNLYRRHGARCCGWHRLHQMTYEADEFRRGWRKCSCPIYASGTLGGRFRRRNTEQNTWTEAKEVAAEWQKAGSWDAKAKPVEPPIETPVAADPLPPRISIADAIRAYLAVREGAGIAPATLRKHRTFTKKLQSFADERGYMMLDQFTSTDMDVFYASWNLGVRTKGKALGTLRGFFRFCMNREWLTKSPVTSDLKPPLGASRVANKVPFTDEELERIIQACDRLNRVTWRNGLGTGVWTGEDVKDFIWVLVYTGLRISDAALFDMSRLRGNEVFLRAKKNGGDVFTWIPDWLRDRLQQRATKHGQQPFVAGHSDRLETITDR